MWMSSHEHTSPLFSSGSLCSPTKERLAAMRGTAPGRHTDLKCAPLQSPGISVSRIEPSGVFFSWFSKSSSRSLGRCLLLGQRSRMNFLSHHIGPLFHQHRSNPGTKLARHGDDGHPRTHMPGVSAGKPSCKTPEAQRLGESPTRTLG
jgi:hypothetical protein